MLKLPATINSNIQINYETYNINKYHNANLLLKLFRSVWWRIHEEITDIDLTCVDCYDRRIDEIIKSAVDVDLYISETRLMERLQSIEFSKSILEFVLLSLDSLRRFPDDGAFYYSIIFETYISPSKSKEVEILDKLNISRSDYYRKKKKAVELLGVMLWGYLLNDNRNVIAI